MLILAAKAEPENGWGRLVALLIAVAVFALWANRDLLRDKIQNHSPAGEDDPDSDEFSQVEEDDEPDDGDPVGEGRGDHDGFSVRYDENGKRYLVARYRK